jgi:hypothetical protein
MKTRYRWPDDVDVLCDRIWQARYALRCAERNSDIDFGDRFASLCAACDDLANERERKEPDVLIWEVALFEVERTWNAARHRGDPWTALPEFESLRQVIEDGWESVTP